MDILHHGTQLWRLKGTKCTVNKMTVFTKLNSEIKMLFENQFKNKPHLLSMEEITSFSKQKGRGESR